MSYMAARAGLVRTQPLPARERPTLGCWLCLVWEQTQLRRLQKGSALAKLVNALEPSCFDNTQRTEAQRERGDDAVGR